MVFRTKTPVASTDTGEMNYQQAIAARFQNHVSKRVETAELVAKIAATQQAH